MYLGIDQSLTGTGVCFMAPRRMAHETFVIKIRGGMSEKVRGGERLKYIYDHIYTFVQQKTRGNFGIIRMAAMEGYAYGLGHRTDANGRSFQAGNPFQLGEVGGIVKLLLENLRIPYVVVNPTGLKQWVKGTPGGPKDVIMAYLTHEFKTLFDDNNAADAYALSLIAMDYVGEWNEPASRITLQQARAHVIEEIKIDPHAVLRKAGRAKIREQRLRELRIEPKIEQRRILPKKLV